MRMSYGQFLVYALVDPGTFRVRYIGKSCSGLKQPRRHFSPKSRRESNHKARWVNSLSERGLAPKIAVLEKAEDAADLNFIERFWIAQGHGLGWPLTNLTPGGDGGANGGWNKGKKHNPETIEKIRASVADRKYRHSEEVRKIISKARRGTKKINGRWVRPTESQNGT